jgi:hypothetical protein
MKRCAHSGVAPSLPVAARTARCGATLTQLALTSLFPVPAGGQPATVFAVRAGFSRLGQGYRSALVLAGTAVVLLLVAVPARAALAGAGFALAGAAITRAVDLAREHRAEAAQAEASRRRDLDETRRLMYAILNARRSRDGMIIATVVNALAHHGLAADPNLAAEHVASVLNAPGLAPESEQWLRQQIDRITAELRSLALTLRPPDCSRPKPPPACRRGAVSVWAVGARVPAPAGTAMNRCAGCQGS